MTLCEGERRGDEWSCSVCGATGRYVGLPIRRHCAVDAPAIDNPIGCCPHAGEDAGRVRCVSCSGAVEIKTFACRSPGVSQTRAAWTTKRLPADVANCRTCERHPSRPSVSPETGA